MTIDIVIPTYNRAGKIGRAIDSAIAAQAIWGGKVIIADDASTDDTVALLEKNYGQEIKSGNVVLLRHQKNRGVTAAKNTGFLASKNDWVIFLDSDDSLLESSFKNVLQQIDKYQNIAMIFFRVQDQDGQFVGELFDGEEWLSLSRYLKHTSYGEALVAVNRRLVTMAPYDEDLRGYEGLGCMRIIKQHGPALLSPVIARCYDRSGDDRLSSPKIFVRRASKLAKGHARVLKEFSAEMPWSERVSLFIKMVIYAGIGVWFSLCS